MEIKWVNENEVPGPGRPGPSYYKKLAELLQANPNRWAIWKEYADIAKFYEFRKRFPELEFRKQMIESTTKGKRCRVYARYVSA